MLALAPDAAGAQAARKLLSPAKWPTLAGTDDVLWGECQGSGQQPYLVGVDLRTAEYASKCSCPSRKFPCKHALALLLLRAAAQGTWTEQPPPGTLQSWLDGRRARAEAPPTLRSEKPADPAAKAKREAARAGKITRGLEELHLWLQDLIREGLQAARSRSYREWDAQAARLVDAQAPGAARLVRQIPGELTDETGEALLTHLGKLSLLCEGWANRDALSDAERLQLLSALGQPLDTAALLAGEGKQERWRVMGMQTEQDGKLNTRRTWLRRESDGRVGMLLEFAPPSGGFAPELPFSSSGLLDVRSVPTLHPQRVLLGAAAPIWEPAAKIVPLSASIPELYAAYARALALDPWLERIGFEIGPVRVRPDPPEVQDAGGFALTLSSSDPYRLLARSRGQPMHLFGEWDGKVFKSLAVVARAAP